MKKLLIATCIGAIGAVGIGVSVPTRAACGPAAKLADFALLHEQPGGFTKNECIGLRIGDDCFGTRDVDC